MTIIELVIMAGILLTLVALGVPAYNRYSQRARIVQAIADIRTLEKDILTEEAYSQRLPNSLDGIGRAGLLDPWGRPYEYLNIGAAKGLGKERKDRFLVPLNTDFDLYSKGRDGESQPPLTAATSQDDIVRANNGTYVGLGSEY